MSEPVSAAIVLGLLLAAIVVLQRPLVARRREADVEVEELRRADLEAAKVAKYREIRDAELDRRTGKLSDADWRAVDRRLREDAVELLRELDELGPAPVDGPGEVDVPAAAQDGEAPAPRGAHGRPA